MNKQPPPPVASRSADWDAAYRERQVPWDVGHPQPVFVGLADSGAVEGPVLDVGCGTGEHALLFAARGLEALGVDFSGVAVGRARQKAVERGVDARFSVHDVLDLPTLGRTFRTIVDSGTFHVFDRPDDVERYVAGLRDVLDSGGTLHLLCFSEQQPGAGGPRRVSQADLRATFSEDDGWRVEAIEPASFEVLPPVGSARAWLARIVRT